MINKKNDERRTIQQFINDENSHLKKVKYTINNLK